MKKRIRVFGIFLALFCSILFVKEAKASETGSDPIIITDIRDLHNASTYPANTDITWIYELPNPGNSTYLKVTFSDETGVFEEDYLSFYDNSDKLIGRKYSSEELKGKSVIVPGTTLKLRLEINEEWVEDDFREVKILNVEGIYATDFELGKEEFALPTNEVYYAEDLFPIKMQPGNESDIILPIEWSSSNEDVLEVREQWDQFEAKGIGDVILTARYNNIEKKCKVHVEAREFYISERDYVIKNGKITPDLVVRDITGSPLLEEGWSYRVEISGNTVKVIGIRGYEGRIKTITIPSDEIKVSQIILSSTSGKIAAGKKVQLSANVFPANANNKAITWKSSNEKVATVNSNGVVTVKKGSGGKKAIITATASDGSNTTASYQITSMKGVVKKVSISGSKSVKAGKSMKLRAKVSASKGANKKLKWTSSNPKYAQVTSSGKVKIYKAGKGKKVKITAMATDGSNKKKTVTVKII